jgi:hypothetical protein
MSERDQRIQSLRIIDEYTWMLIRQIREAVEKRLGEPGLAALADGFRRYGYYRGQTLFDSPIASAEGRDAMSLLRAWDVSDLMLTQADARLKVEGGPRRATVKLDRVPGADYFAKHGVDKDLLTTYWSETLKGIADGFDDDMAVSFAALPRDPAEPWSITFDYKGKSSGRSDAPPEDAFANKERSIRLSRRTYGVFGALGMYVSRALTDRFDAAAEEVMREALYNSGVERGRDIREQALQEGLPLNFQTWIDIWQRRDPEGASFVFRGKSHISPGVINVVCTHCPLASVWAEEGHRGLGFGYLFDVAMHKGWVEGFHPGAKIAWETVKTRGDKVCDFRFLIPELVTRQDPEWVQKAAGLT